MEGQEKKKAKIKWDRKTWSSAKKIFSYMLPYKWAFIFGLVCLSFGSLMFMIFPAAAGEMANAAAGKSRFHFTIQDYGLFFVFILVLQGFFAYFRSYLMSYVSEKGMAQMKKEVYDNMVTQSVTFFEKNRVGELTSRITADVAQIQNVISVTLAEFLRQIITLIVGVVILAWLTPRLSLIMLLSFPLIVIVAIIFGRYIRKLSRSRQDAIAQGNIIAEEALHGYQAVKSFSNENYEKNRFSNTINEVVRISLNFARVKGVFFIFITTILFGGIFFILYEGALLVQSGNMAIGDLFSFIIYTGIIGGAIASLGTFYTDIAGALGAADRILDILSQAPEQLSQKTDPGIVPVHIHGDIVFDQVSFSYPTRPDKEVLHQVSVTFEAGKKTALVGASGAGKSTITQLLFRFHEPDSGEISIDGDNVNSFDLRSYRQNFAMVPQDILLFGGTIRENIAYGKPEASDDEIITAATRANAMEFIESFPEGLDTLVGDRGVRLSGGQKQRIAIARAIIKDPRVLILDEATSSLDAGSEKLVQDALNNLMEGRTSVIIAHRLATIRDVDKIIVLKDGAVIESGDHASLMQNPDGIYAILAKMQDLALYAE
jgi:ABC-type multidrug transport system fused ATPase/permease subunit